jgi:hypothetical protein
MALSWDSLIASCLLGISHSDSSRQLRLATSFGVADGVASMLAASPIIAHSLPSWLRLTDPSIVVWVYLAVVLALPYFAQSNRSPGFVYVVPLLFSLDNLLTPQVDASALTVLTLGISSALASLLGFAAARIIKKAAYKAFGSRERALELPS